MSTEEVEPVKVEKHARFDDNMPYKTREQHQAHGYKLKLGQFHRFTGKKPVDKKRNQSTRKKIRDLERLVTKEGMPAEIIEAKTKDLLELKKQLRYKKWALRNYTKYKQIRLNEKKKCMRRQKRAEKEIKAINNRIIKEGQTMKEWEEQKEEDTKEQQEILVQLEKDIGKHTILIFRIHHSFSTRP